MDLLGDEQHLRHLTRHDDALALRVVDRVGGGAITLRVERDAERVDDGGGGFQPGLGGFAIGLDGDGRVHGEELFFSRGDAAAAGQSQQQPQTERQCGERFESFHGISSITSIFLDNQYSTSLTNRQT